MTCGQNFRRNHITECVRCYVSVAETYNKYITVGNKFSYFFGKFSNHFFIVVGKNSEVISLKCDVTPLTFPECIKITVIVKDNFSHGKNTPTIIYVYVSGRIFRKSFNGEVCTVIHKKILSIVQIALKFLKIFVILFRFCLLQNLKKDDIIIDVSV